MSKPKIILFSRQLSNCPCYNTTFNADFETQTVASGKDFWRGICQEKADAAIVCLCSAVNEKDDVLFRLLPLSGPVPVLTCTRNLTPDFIQMARQQGVNRFLRCTMKREEIRDTVFKAIRHGGLWEWLETYYQEGLDFSPHIRRLIEEIMHTLPRRIQESEMAQRLGISRSWLQKLCRRAFGTSFTGIMRRIRVHQALCLMHLTA
ncbi:MAG: helix-turn-helix transcriptional regulator, partial [Phycisphaerae bacterium]|nr:helix-turn-helix transcriptional regulator [Phycisphaerae bacterium]NIX01529.1 hypothetical protein [Phycisphaerae bacterium]NIX26759.1 hypothetical protein [Phycisphaerae bacterium]